MFKNTAEHIRPLQTTKTSPGIKKRLLNLLGLLLSFGTAFGGLFLVQYRLTQEEADLFRSGGVILTTLSSDNAEAEERSETEVTRAKLTESQLTEIIQQLEHVSEIYPHEPKQGQLSMAEAIEYGKDWLENFFIPHLGKLQPSSREYRASCYLWTPLEKAESSDDPLLGFWSVNLSGQGIDAVLILNAASGQVLNASVSCFSPLEYQNDIEPLAILQDYAASFGLETSDYIFSQKEDDLKGSETTLYQNIGSEGTFAAVNAHTIVIGGGDGLSELVEYTEIFNLHLYVTNL